VTTKVTVFERIRILSLIFPLSPALGGAVDPLLATLNGKCEKPVLDPTFSFPPLIFFRPSVRPTTNDVTRRRRTTDFSTRTAYRTASAASEDHLFEVLRWNTKQTHPLLRSSSHNIPFIAGETATQLHLAMRKQSMLLQQSSTFIMPIL
jgi:hypothetical protein